MAVRGTKEVHTQKVPSYLDNQDEKLERWREVERTRERERETDRKRGLMRLY